MRKAISRTAEINIHIDEDDIFSLLTSQNLSQVIETSDILGYKISWESTDYPNKINVNIKLEDVGVNDLSFMKIYLENRKKNYESIL